MLEKFLNVTGPNNIRSLDDDLLSQMCKYNILSCKHASYRNVWKHNYLHFKKKSKVKSITILSFNLNQSLLINWNYLSIEKIPNAESSFVLQFAAITNLSQWILSQSKNITTSDDKVDFIASERPSV